MNNYLTKIAYYLDEYEQQEMLDKLDRVDNADEANDILESLGYIPSLTHKLKHEDEVNRLLQRSRSKDFRPKSATSAMLSGLGGLGGAAAGGLAGATLGRSLGGQSGIFAGTIGGALLGGIGAGIATRKATYGPEKRELDDKTVAEENNKFLKYISDNYQKKV